MSTRSSSSPGAMTPSINRPDGEEGGLPHGQCRYILLNPEIKGQRCACVGFTLNRGLPGVSCQCGHLSCYHVKSSESPPEKNEVEDLRRRIQLLEGQLDRENQTGIGGALNQVVQRIGDLEEHFETNKGEMNEEMQKCYSNVSRVWGSVAQLEKSRSGWEDRTGQYDEQLDDHDDRIHRLSDRLTEINDAAIATEERVEVLESKPASSTWHHGRGRIRGSGSESISPVSPSPLRNHRSLAAQSAAPPRPVPMSFPWAGRGRSGGVPVHPAGGSWTVHVSLLPTAAQPFPFEKDTNAYKRCLSRGLHQMIVVEGTDGESFTAAVIKAFGKLLRGREWVPLQARLCDAVTLEGLPMLRPLDPNLIRGSYGLDFLRDHCAVCHPNGKIESLYIAMLQETFSWHFLRRSRVHMEGLEASWGYDELLDPDENLDDASGEEDRLAAGDIMMPLPSSLKRTASEMSRAASFSTSEGSEPPRPKLARTACLPVEVRRHGVETV